jgi:sortase A
MRIGRTLEIGAWIIGVAFLGQYASARLFFEHARAAGIESFRAATDLQLAAAVETDPGPDAAQPSLQIDRTLWSQGRINAFAETTASPGVPEAVLSIPALQLEVPIYHGVTEINLNRGAAHIEGTAALAPSGNIGIAAHRDGFFRKLKDIAIDDEVVLDVGDRMLRYRVVDIGVVVPSEVHVLEPTVMPSITLVTCYPFYFVGTAPERYIVRAELVITRGVNTLAHGKSLQTKF